MTKFKVVGWANVTDTEPSTGLLSQDPSPSLTPVLPMEPSVILSSLPSHVPSCQATALAASSQHENPKHDSIFNSSRICPYQF